MVEDHSLSRLHGITPVGYRNLYVPPTQGRPPLTRPRKSRIIGRRPTLGYQAEPRCGSHPISSDGVPFQSDLYATGVTTSSPGLAAYSTAYPGKRRTAKGLPQPGCAREPAMGAIVVDHGVPPKKNG